MLLIKRLFFIFIFSTSLSAIGYEVINRDYKLPPEQIRIDFSQSIYKKKAKLNFRPCKTCSWETYDINPHTDFFKKVSPIDYINFKQQVKRDSYNPPSKNFIVYISVNIKTKEVFTIKWDYLEL
jgi:hypothetical protein